MPDPYFATKRDINRGDAPDDAARSMRRSIKPDPRYAPVLFCHYADSASIGALFAYFFRQRATLPSFFLCR